MKQTTVRLPDELADEAETVARVQGTSVNALIIESLTAEIDRVRADEEFTTRAARCSSGIVSCSSAWPSDPLSQPRRVPLAQRTGHRR